jgi:hypothetical protein
MFAVMGLVYKRRGKKEGRGKGGKRGIFIREKMLIILYTIIIAHILCACAVLHCAVMKNCAV